MYGRDQRGFIRRIFAHDDEGFRYRGMLKQYGLHFAAFDPVPTNFYLPVRSPDKLDTSVRQEAPKIPGIVQAGVSAQWIRTES